MPTTTTNSQVTDGVTQANVKVVAEAPAIAIGNLMQSMAHSMSMSFENATAIQQQTCLTMQAATTQGVMALYSIDTVAIAAAFKERIDQP